MSRIHVFCEIKMKLAKQMTWSVKSFLFILSVGFKFAIKHFIFSSVSIKQVFSTFLIPIYTLFIIYTQMREIYFNKGKFSVE